MVVSQCVLLGNRGLWQLGGGGGGGGWGGGGVRGVRTGEGAEVDTSVLTSVSFSEGCGGCGLSHEDLRNCDALQDLGPGPAHTGLGLGQRPASLRRTVLRTEKSLQGRTVYLYCVCPAVENNVFKYVGHTNFLFRHIFRIFMGNQHHVVYPFTV